MIGASWASPFRLELGILRRVPETPGHLCGKVEGDTSRGVEGPGPKTLRQPTERHGGNAGIDEEAL